MADDSITLGMVAHGYNPSTWEAESGDWSWRPVLVHIETLFLKTETGKKKKKSIVLNRKE